MIEINSRFVLLSHLELLRRLKPNKMELRTRNKFKFCNLESFEISEEAGT